MRGDRIPCKRPNCSNDYLSTESSVGFSLQDMTDIARKGTRPATIRQGYRELNGQHLEWYSQGTLSGIVKGLLEYIDWKASQKTTYAPLAVSTTTDLASTECKELLGKCLEKKEMEPWFGTLQKLDACRRLWNYSGQDDRNYRVNVMMALAFPNEEARNKATERERGGRLTTHSSWDAE